MKTIPITRRAAIARFNRHLAKKGQKLRVLKTPIDSLYHFVIVEDGGVVAMADLDGLLAWFREDGILKPYEVLGE